MIYTDLHACAEAVTFWPGERTDRFVAIGKTWHWHSYKDSFKTCNILPTKKK